MEKGFFFLLSAERKHLCSLSLILGWYLKWVACVPLLLIFLYLFVYLFKDTLPRAMRTCALQHSTKELKGSLLLVRFPFLYSSLVLFHWLKFTVSKCVECGMCSVHIGPTCNCNRVIPSSSCTFIYLYIYLYGHGICFYL